MSIDLNHTIVHATDPQASADLLAEMLERPAPVRFDGGRGVYRDDSDGHALEIITRPHGSGA